MCKCTHDGVMDEWAWHHMGKTRSISIRQQPQMQSNLTRMTSGCAAVACVYSLSMKLQDGAELLTCTLWALYFLHQYLLWTAHYPSHFAASQRILSSCKNINQELALCQYFKYGRDAGEHFQYFYLSWNAGTTLGETKAISSKNSTKK